MSEKLSERMRAPLSIANSHIIRAFADEVAALEQQLAAEQAAHDQIATICFRVGADTTDGTSISAVLSLADIVIDFRQQLAAKDAEIARLRSPQWIALADQEPPEWEEVLLYGPEHGVVTGHLNTGAPPDGDWWIRGEWQSGVTHWAALPSPPAALAETPAAPHVECGTFNPDVKGKRLMTNGRWDTPAAPLTALALPEDDVPDAAPEAK